MSKRIVKAIQAADAAAESAQRLISMRKFLRKLHRTPWYRMRHNRSEAGGKS